MLGPTTTPSLEGVGVMKDKELKPEKIEASLRLGGAGEGRRVQRSQQGEGSVEGRV